MTYIVNDSCIRCKIMDCVEVCPVDCFYEGEMLVIHPDECIDCGVCVPECPVDAIKPDTDPGLAVTKDDYSLESYLLGTNHYQIELLANLDQLPEAGALIMVSFPKPEGGTGFPARAVAILP